MADSRIAYGLAKKYGIDTKGMSPKEVWDALKEKGVTEEGYKKEQGEKKQQAEKIYNTDVPTPAENERLREMGIKDKPRENLLGIEDDKKPRKQLKPVFIDTSGMKFENSFQEIKYKSEERKRLNARQTMEDIA